MTPSDLCPACQADLAYVVGDRTYSRRIGVEIPGVYDGVLFWQCPACGGNWHRWPEGHPLRRRAAHIIDAPAPATDDDAPRHLLNDPKDRS